MTHSFQRYTGAGNTFVVMNTWEDPLSLSREEMRMLVRKACDYEDSVGADGMILVNQSGLGAQFRMDFYNPDGTTGMLCGNGTRCAVRAASDYGLVNLSPDPPLSKGKGKQEIDFEVLGAINHADLLPNGNIRAFFQDPSIIRLKFPLALEKHESVEANYIDLGSQHVVIFYDELNRFGESDIEQMNIEHFGPLLRWHPEFTPKGANANFIEIREDGEEKYLRIRTWERGVEGETLACGTGCMSSAIAARMNGRIPKIPVRLLTQSGEYVTVDFEIQGDRVTNLSLEGSVIRGEEGMLKFDETTGTLDVEYV